MPTPNASPIPRAILSYARFRAEIWCISDLLEGLAHNLQSSSSEKASRLYRIFDFAGGVSPALVVAVGTAATPIDQPNQAGGVVVGTSVFLHDGKPDSPTSLSDWSFNQFDALISSSISMADFTKLAGADQAEMTKRLMPVPLQMTTAPSVSFGFGDVALGTLNVTTTTDYGVADPHTKQAFEALDVPSKAVSIETTHGLIRVQSDSPFVFVSGIANRIGGYGTEVLPREDAQNTAAAHNAGVAVAWMLGSLDQSGLDA